MLDTTDRKASEQAERERRNKARRAAMASIVEGLQTILEGDEQLLAFGRGRMAGGWRGKLAIGLEAFFAPFANIGLTDRRFILQHIHLESGKPSEIMPHFFPLPEIAALTFADIETFGAEPAGRLTLRLTDEQHFRLRLDGEANCANAKALAQVFATLTQRHTPVTSPTQTICASCGHILDQPSKFCPYCGQLREEAEGEKGRKGEGEAEGTGNREQGTEPITQLPNYPITQLPDAQAPTSSDPGSASFSAESPSDVANDLPEPQVTPEASASAEEAVEGAKEAKKEKRKSKKADKG